MVANVQLLVHAGAPSFTKDDERYRAQAVNYFRFKGHRIGDDRSSGRDERVVNNHSAKRDLPTTSLMPPLSSLQDPTIYLDDTQSAFTALESQLITSSQPIFQHSSPKKRRASAIVEDIISPTNRSDASVAPESDSNRTRSSYLRSPVLDRSTKRQKGSPVEEPVTTFLRSPFDSSQHIHRYAAKPSPPSAAHDNPSRITRYETPTVKSQTETTSQLPSSYSLSNVTSGSSKRPNLQSPRSVSDPGPILQSSISHESQQKSQDRTKAPSTQPTPVKHNEYGPVATTSDAETVPKASVAVVKDDKLSFADISFQIRPEEPPVTVQHFKTHVTDKLHYLAEKSQITDHFRPLSISRDIRISERGYWTFDSSIWPQQAQLDFWRSLQRMIGEEVIAGWGAWCSRESEDDKTLGVVKVFCWGEVVKHVYLLLFVASLSKVRKLGLRWIDAEEQVVVQMPGIQPT